jgi:hypothetical protein
MCNIGQACILQLAARAENQAGIGVCIDGRITFGILLQTDLLYNTMAIKASKTFIYIAD